MFVVDALHGAARVSALARVLLVVLAVAVGGGLVASTASAYVKRPNAAFEWNATTGKWALTADAWAQLKQGGALVPPVQVGGSTVPESVVTSRLDKARQAGRILPGLRAIGGAGLQIAVFAGAGEIYSKALKMEIPGQGIIYRAVSGMSWNPAMTGGQVLKLTYPATVTTYAGHDLAFPGGSAYECAAHAPPCYTTAGGSWLPEAGWVVYVSGTASYGVHYCLPVGTAYSFGSSQAMSSFPGLSILTTAAGGGVCSPGASTYWQLADDATVDEAVNTKMGSDAGYNAAAAGDKTTFVYTEPTHTAGDQSAASDTFGAGGNSSQVGASQTVAQSAAEGALIKQVAPGAVVTTSTDAAAGTNFRPFTLPRPFPSETASDYVERLRDLGWHGEVVLEDADATGFDAGSAGAIAVPGTLAGVQVGAGTLVKRFDSATGDPEPWPSNPPVVTTGDEVITVRRIPGDDPPPPDDGGTCECPPVDFGPLEADWSDKFPLGLFHWVTGFFDTLPNTAVAPTFTISKPSQLGGGEITITAPTNPYKGTSDAIMKVLVVVGSVWFAGTWLIGWNKGDSLT